MSLNVICNRFLALERQIQAQQLGVELI